MLYVRSDVILEIILSKLSYFFFSHVSSMAYLQIVIPTDQGSHAAASVLDTYREERMQFNIHIWHSQ